MKRLVCLLLALLFIGSLCACEKSKGGGSSGTTASKRPEANAITPSVADDSKTEVPSTIMDAEHLSEDPVSFAYSVALREFKEMIDVITPDHIRIFTSDEDINELALFYKNDMEAITSFKTKIFICEPNPIEYAYRTCIELGNALMNAMAPYGSTCISAVSVISSMNQNNSYWCGNAEALKNKVYLVQFSSEGKTRAIVICYFNYHGCLETVTVPIFDNVSFNLKKALAGYKLDSVKSPKINDEQVDALIFASLDNVKKETEHIQEIINELLGYMSIRGKDLNLYISQASDIPREVSPLCQKCAFLSKEPILVLKWDLERIDTSSLVSSDFSLMSVAEVAANSINHTNESISGLIAQSVMRMLIAAPVDIKDSVYWIYCASDENADDGCVCAITFLTNENGICDVTAEPIYNNEIIALAAQAAGGNKSVLSETNGLAWLAEAEVIESTGIDSFIN